MLVTGVCKICGGRPILDIGQKSREEAEALLKKMEFGHCSVGYHVEIGKMTSYYLLDWQHLFKTEAEARAFIEKEEVKA